MTELERVDERTQQSIHFSELQKGDFFENGLLLYVKTASKEAIQLVEARAVSVSGGHEKSEIGSTKSFEEGELVVPIRKLRITIIN